jgi:hypothetical protein
MPGVTSDYHKSILYPRANWEPLPSRADPPQRRSHPHRARSLGYALLYAQAALRDFEQLGAGATPETDKTQQLIAEIEQDLT